jgi:hypothetical protein
MLTGTRSNRFAVGARVRVVSGQRSQIREVNCGNGYQSQSTFRLHFGLGAAQQVDLVEVRWPGGGVETLKDVAADQLLQIVEGATKQPSPTAARAPTQ